MNATYYTDTAGLVAEHYDGRYSGLLSIASDFLLRHRATQGLASDEAIAEAAFYEGIGESEIAAALEMESGESYPLVDPRGRGWTIK